MTQLYARVMSFSSAMHWVDMLGICTMSAIYLWLKFRSLDKRIHNIEMSVVRSVMEENPNLVGKVVKTYGELYSRGGMSSASAMKEARRLHGLDF